MYKFYFILFFLLFGSAFAKDIVCEVAKVELYDGDSYVDEKEPGSHYHSAIERFMIRDFEFFGEKKEQFYDVETFRRDDNAPGKIRMTNTKYTKLLRAHAKIISHIQV